MKLNQYNYHDTASESLIHIILFHPSLLCGWKSVFKSDRSLAVIGDVTETSFNMNKHGNWELFF